MYGGILPETDSKRTWNLTVERLLSFWEGLFAGTLLVSGRLILSD